MDFDYIFEPYLLAICTGISSNTYYDIIEKWNNIEYLFQFYNKNLKYINDNPYIKCKTASEFIKKVNIESDRFDDRLLECAEEKNFDKLFLPIRYGVKESNIERQKSKQNLLRLYALKIESNQYLITGGAIKITSQMQDHPLTTIELKKLNKFQGILIENGVIDSDSFYEYINYG